MNTTLKNILLADLIWMAATYSLLFMVWYGRLWWNRRHPKLPPKWNDPYCRHCPRCWVEVGDKPDAEACREGQLCEKCRMELHPPKMPPGILQAPGENGVFGPP